MRTTTLSFCTLTRLGIATALLSLSVATSGKNNRRYSSSVARCGLIQR